MASLTLVTRTKDIGKHVSQSTVNEFEESIQLSGNVSVVDNQAILLPKVVKYAFSKCGISVKMPSCINTGRNYFSVLMGPAFEKVFPHFLLAEKRSVYLFDAWPDKHEAIVSFLQRAGINNVFFSSSQVTDIFNAKILDCKAHWIPEGILPSTYQALDYDQKNIDVLQFGRKYDDLHQKIVGRLEGAQKTYLYERNRGELVFRDHHAFIDGLARTKISICIPSTITHPERSGTISTMTVRYLQSMVSKCLIVGVMPEEMRDLFDYDPIIEIDMRNPSGQLRDILDNMHRYTALIEQNYDFVNRFHTWSKRWNSIERILL